MEPRSAAAPSAGLPSILVHSITQNTTFTVTSTKCNVNVLINVHMYPHILHDKARGVHVYVYTCVRAYYNIFQKSLVIVLFLSGALEVIGLRLAMILT